MSTRKNETEWQRLTLEYEHADGQVTTFYMHTDDRKFVLSEHPKNEGPGVWQSATEIGDHIMENNLANDSKAKPEDLVLYAERHDGRFDQWQAKTTLYENTSETENVYEHRASEWQWRNAKQTEHPDLERQMETQLEHGHQSRSRMTHEERMQQDLRDTPLAKTDQSEALRDEARQQQSRQAADDASRRNEEDQTQKQRHER